MFTCFFLVTKKNELLGLSLDGLAPLGILGHISYPSTVSGRCGPSQWVRRLCRDNGIDWS
jgi:hypothetical protein